MFVAFVTGLILCVGWTWQRRDGLLWAMPVVLSINYFLLIRSQWKITGEIPLRPLEGNDGWQLTKILAQLCEKAGVKPPKVTVIETETPQAFVVGRSKPHLFVTQGFLERLDPLEREAILALEVAAIKNELPFIFSILGSFFDLIFLFLSGIDCGISWILGTRRRWAHSVTLLIASPVLYLVQRWCLSPSDYFKMDKLAAELCSDRDAFCQALWKIESSSWTQPLNAHPAWTHAFAVGPWEPKGALGFLQPQPSVKRRIREINGAGL
jgi:heat shock protein HtpX